MRQGTEAPGDQTSAPSALEFDLLQAASDCQSLGCYIKDQNLKFRMVNSAFAKLMGHPREYMIGKKSSDFFESKDAAHFERVQTEVLATGKPQELKRRTSTDISTILKVERIETSTGEHFVCVQVMEVSNLKKVVNQQQQALDLFEESVASMAQRLMEFSAEKIEYVSDKTAELFEVPPDILAVGQPWSAYFDFLWERGDFGKGDAALQRLEKIKSDLTAGVSRRIERQTSSGRTLLIEVEPREVEGCIVTISDITEMTQREAELRNLVVKISEASGAVRGAMDEISAGMSDLSARTEHQASSLEETSASMEEISATVRENADNAQIANEIASTASESAVLGGAVVERAMEAMNLIEGSSKKIEDITALTQEIAFQTNLLALNASVEAARAGEAGRGFAVVANEVRALSHRAAAASKDIRELITDSVQQIDEGAKLVAEAGTRLAESVASAKQVADKVSEIASASFEQTTGINQVSSAISGMDELTQKNAALVEETTGAVESAIHQMNTLQQVVRGQEASQATDSIEPPLRRSVVA